MDQAKPSGPTARQASQAQRRLLHQQRHPHTRQESTKRSSQVVRPGATIREKIPQGHRPILAPPPNRRSGPGSARWSHAIGPNPQLPRGSTPLQSRTRTITTSHIAETRPQAQSVRRCYHGHHTAETTSQGCSTDHLANHDQQPVNNRQPFNCSTPLNRSATHQLVNTAQPVGNPSTRQHRSTGRQPINSSTPLNRSATHQLVTTAQPVGNPSTRQQRSTGRQPVQLINSAQLVGNPFNWSTIGRIAAKADTGIALAPTARLGED